MNLKLSILGALLSASSVSLPAEEAPQNRGLWAFVNGDKVQVSWRMRHTDSKAGTTYKLYADGKLALTRKNSSTTAQMSKANYEKAAFSLEVLDETGRLIDRQEGVKVRPAPYFDIPLSAPVIRNEKGEALITYTPGDGSAYDVDGDGEQEIILKWMPSDLFHTETQTPGRQFFDCYKLDGRRLWRIDMGINMGAGNNYTFMVWDFDQDGKGELIVKSAPGSRDATGRYVGQQLAGIKDTATLYFRGSDKWPTRGEEWITCYNAETGAELATIDYWPRFDIQENWYYGKKNGDTYLYGRRGNGFKGAVVYIPVDGVRRPCCYAQRGIYSYVYATTYSWDGTELKEVWRHASDVPGSGLFAEGAHTCVSADLDGDGYDEVAIGAAAIDHDGSLLWRTGLGHGDALHVGEFNPDNEGLEVFRITEGATAYDANVMDAKTGRTLASLPYRNGDVGRGLIMDLDSTSAGSEFFCHSYDGIFSASGDSILPKALGNNGLPNYRIYWDDDLLDEHLAGTKLSKYDLKNRYFTRMESFNSSKSYKCSSINDSKANPILQCDLFGDWREELVFFVSPVNDATVTSDYALRILTTTYGTKYKLPWLRDDHTYNLAIACQNVGYSMPPHLGYNPLEYYAEPETTAIERVETVRTEGDEAKFDLLGRPSSGSGLLVHNGRLVFFRSGGL